MGHSEHDVLARWRCELNQLAQRLRDSADAADWQQVQQLDSLLAQRLILLRQHPAVKGQLATELARLQAQHHSVMVSMREVRRVLEQEMARFNAQREGLRVYEESREWL
ncbi:hypothetical protein ACFOSS_08220 [Pseudaeromonas sharmana]|uniref:Flagellar protein FliT n=1 Tax=Pseudaeromonas sharmana TaxID=328412 RepID=A0ABV8CMN2_9GAMM